MIRLFELKSSNAKWISDLTLEKWFRRLSSKSQTPTGLSLTVSKLASSANCLFSAFASTQPIGGSIFRIQKYFGCESPESLILDIQTAPIQRPQGFLFVLIGKVRVPQRRQKKLLSPSRKSKFLLLHRGHLGMAHSITRTHTSQMEFNKCPMKP